ncbi:MAG: peptide chain release factor N(5)-glutamine methyltransferase [Bacteroidota bacterium]
MSDRKVQSIQVAYQELVEQLTPLQGEREAQNIARIIFEDAFGLFDFSSQNNFKESQQLADILRRLLKNEPFQFVFGQAYFYGLKFKVTPDVLIPRPETEELVYWILNSALPVRPKILDIGTGSGCIPVTLKKKLPESDIYAVDVSEKALTIAYENSLQNNVAIHTQVLNILDKSQWDEIGQMDVIVSNPPYIPYREKPLMPPQVLDFEPDFALFVENDDPLIFYTTIADFAQKKLTPTGRLFFECNEFNALKVVALLNQKGFSNVELQRDMSGKDRMIRAIFNEQLAMNNEQ